MEAQLNRQDDPQYVVEEEQHHEKKSMLKKVKDKAKKIKNTIKNRGQGGHDEHELDNHGSDDLEEDEEDEDDLMEEDPVVHTSPAYKPDVTGSDTYGGHGVNLEKPTALREDPYPMQKNEPTSGYGGQGIDLEKPTALREDIYPKQVNEPTSGYGGQGINLEKPTALGEDIHPMQVNEPTSGSGYVSGRPMAAEPERSAPSLPDITGHRAAEQQERYDTPSLTDMTGRSVLDPSHASKKDEGVQPGGIKVGGLTDLQDAPTPMDSSNYQSKTVDPSGKGGREADIDPLIRSLEKARIHDESGVREPPGSTGSHDQFAPESQTTSKIGIDSDSFPKTHDSSKPEGLPHDTVQGKASDQGSYIGMITGVPSAISGKAIAAKNAVASKLGYGGTESAKSPGSGSGSPASSQFTPDTYDSTKPENLPQDTVQGKAPDQGSYIGKVAGVPSTIAGTAIAAKNVVASKLGYGGTDSVKAPVSGVRESPASTGSNDQFTFAPESLPTDKSGIDSSKPEDLPQDTLHGKASDQGSYIGKIAGVPSTIAGTAIAAKNVVASKLGYGGTESGTAPETGEFVGAEKSPPSTIADKAAAAKNVVASKLGYGGTESTTTPETGEFVGAEKSPSSTPYMQGVASKVTGTLAPVYAKVADTGSSVISRVKGTGNKDETSDINKGTGGKGVMDYLSEKFRPGEEDKALSRDISDALHVRKETLVKTGEPKLVGKVVDATEGQSTILAEAKKEGDDVKVVGPENVNKGVVNLVKDTVSSWVGKGGQQQQTQGSPESKKTTEGQAAGEIGHPLSVPEDKKLD